MRSRDKMRCLTLRDVLVTLDTETNGIRTENERVDGGHLLSCVRAHGGPANLNNFDSDDVIHGRSAIWPQASKKVSSKSQMK